MQLTHDDITVILEPSLSCWGIFKVSVTDMPVIGRGGSGLFIKISFLQTANVHNSWFCSCITNLLSVKFWCILSASPSTWNHDLIETNTTNWYLTWMHAWGLFISGNALNVEWHGGGTFTCEMNYLVVGLS